MNRCTTAIIVAMRCSLRLARSRVRPLWGEGVLGVGGEGVHLGAVGVGAARQPLAAHPSQAQVAAGPGRQVGVAGELELGQVGVYVAVEPGGVDAADAATEGGAEDRDDDAGRASGATRSGWAA